MVNVLYVICIYLCISDQIIMMKIVSFNSSGALPDPPVLIGVSIAHSLVFCIMVSPFVIFLFTIALTDLIRLTNSDFLLVSSYLHLP